VRRGCKNEEGGRNEPICRHRQKRCVWAGGGGGGRLPGAFEGHPLCRVVLGSAGSTHWDDGVTLKTWIVIEGGTEKVWRRQIDQPPMAMCR